MQVIEIFSTAQDTVQAEQVLRGWVRTPGFLAGHVVQGCNILVFLEATSIHADVVRAAGWRFVDLAAEVVEQLGIIAGVEEATTPERWPAARTLAFAEAELAQVARNTEGFWLNLLEEQQQIQAALRTGEYASSEEEATLVEREAELRALIAGVRVYQELLAQNYQHLCASAGLVPGEGG